MGRRRGSGTSREADLPPGPELPRIAQTAAWYTRPAKFLDSSYRQYGDAFTHRVVAKAFFGPQGHRDDGTWVVLSHPSDIRTVFTASQETLLSPNKFLEPVLGPRSVFVLEDPEHVDQRKLLLAPFHGSHVERFTGLMADAARQEIERWKVGVEFPLMPRMKAVTLDVIVRATFGISDPSRLQAATRDVRTMVTRLTDGWRVVTMGLLGAVLGGARASQARPIRAVVEPVERLIAEEVERRRASGDLEGRDDILSMLMSARRDDGAPMSDGEIRDQVISLIVAGHETTGTSLAWAVERLVRRPDVVDKLRLDLDSGSTAYLDAVIRETMRLHTVVPFVARKLGTDLEVGGRVLPAGVWVVPCPYLVHRRGDIYPDPLAFRPERFLGTAPGTYTWIPFGGGTRRCLGATFALAEMRAVLEALVSQCDLSCSDPRPEEPRRRLLTLAPSKGARVAMDARRVGSSPVG